MVAYVLLVAARVACAFDREFAVRLDLGGQVLDVSVRGATVEVVPADRDDAVAADPLRLLDGLTERCLRSADPLRLLDGSRPRAARDVLAAPDDVRAALGLLARSM